MTDLLTAVSIAGGRQAAAPPEGRRQKAKGKKQKAERECGKRSAETADYAGFDAPAVSNAAAGTGSAGRAACRFSSIDTNRQI